MSKYTIQINSLTCHAASDPDGTDNVWFFYQSDGGVPVRYPFGAMKTNDMSPQSVWRFISTDADGWPPVVVSFDHDLQITVWDQDLGIDISITDFIGNLDITPTSTSGDSPDVTNGASSRYTFNWSWVN